jgi:hypothetical protein
VNYGKVYQQCPSPALGSFVQNGFWPAKTYPKMYKSPSRFTQTGAFAKLWGRT